MILSPKFLRCLLLLPLLLLLSSCAALLTKYDQLPHHRQMAAIPGTPVCRVAVLPFLNDSDYPLADAILAKVFATQLGVATNFLVIQEGDILKIYQQLHLLPGDEPTPEQLQLIASRLDAQLLVTGTVIEMRENPTAGGGSTRSSPSTFCCAAAPAASRCGGPTTGAKGQTIEPPCTSARYRRSPG
jgi:hypothetical protein